MESASGGGGNILPARLNFFELWYLHLKNMSPCWWHMPVDKAFIHTLQ